MKLIITSGHSYSQGGASANGLFEHELTIDFKHLLVKSIKTQDPSIEVIIDDDNDSLSTVIKKVGAVATPTDILVDIHFNAGPSFAKGTESFIKLEAGEREHHIAERLTELFSKMLNTPNRGVKYENQSQHQRLGMLHTKAISILVEIQFITHENSMEEYKEMKERLAIGVANILIQELKK